jgi:hypothetical protein
VPMNAVLRRMHGGFIEALRANVKDSRLLPIHPHSNVPAHECWLAPIDEHVPAKKCGHGETTTTVAAFPPRKRTAYPLQQSDGDDMNVYSGSLERFRG